MRAIVMASTATGFPVGGIPISSPSFVPVPVQRVTTRSPSAIFVYLDAAVRVGGVVHRRDALGAGGTLHLGERILRIVIDRIGRNDLVECIEIARGGDQRERISPAPPRQARRPG
jgi:hypothetical protein